MMLRPRKNILDLNNSERILKLRRKIIKKENLDTLWKEYIYTANINILIKKIHNHIF